MHEMVNVVALVSGTVAAPPESELWLKLPSGEVSVHCVTPCVFQKMEVRVASGTDAGTAQICTTDGTVAVLVAAGAGAGATGFGAGVVC